MNFEDFVVKDSPGLCRCCLSEGCYKDLGTEYNWMNENEVYADMLLDCFDIGITQHNDGPNGAKRLICEVCITRLRDACNFKKQVLDSEKKFIDMLGRGEFKPKVVLYQKPMKAETIDTNVEDIFPSEVEFLEDVEYTDSEEVIKAEDTESMLPTTSEDAASTAKPKKGRPKKQDAVARKTKPKMAKVVKGCPESKPKGEATSKSSLTATKRNRLTKRNAITLLECSTILPFKWHRQNYLCFYCHLTLKSIETLKKHTKEHETPSIKSAVTFLRRDEKVKVDVSSIECRLCGAEIKDLNTLIDHLKLVHNKVFNESDYGLIPYMLDGGYQCAICSKSFEYFIKLNQHMNVHYGDYVCELCGKSFLSSERLRCHSLSHGSKFHCKLCSVSFDSLTLKNGHDSTVHGRPKLLKCHYCPEKFANYTTRKEHHNSAHNIEMPIYKCPVCAKSFQILSKMRVHLKEVHLRERNFSCSMCEQRFFSKTQVQKHMVKHVGARVHQCEICKKSYARKQTLRDHMRIHKEDNKTAELA